jgi:ankyrin repeat protein
MNWNGKHKPAVVTSCVETLLDLGANINAANSQCNALMLAVQHSNFELCKLLIRRVTSVTSTYSLQTQGININFGVPGYYGYPQNPLTIALERGNIRFVKYRYSFENQS